MPDWRWVFGLSVSDELSWAAAQVDLDAPPDALGHTAYLKGPGSLLRGELGPLHFENDMTDLESKSDLVARRLGALSRKNELAEICRNVQAVGISVIGVPDPAKLHLKSIARANLVNQRADYVIDFGPTLENFFPNLSRDRKIRNGATTMALAESAWQTASRAGCTYFLVFGEGVNGAILLDGRPLSEQDAEFAHILPPLHPRDANFNPTYSRCTLHKTCYEGVASAYRIRKQWGVRSLQGLEDYPEKPWEIFAHYIGNLCWAGAAAFVPDRILLAGSVIFPDLLPEINGVFRRLNEGETKVQGIAGVRYVDVGGPGYIRLAQFRQNEMVWGALELARLAACGLWDKVG